MQDSGRLMKILIVGIYLLAVLYVLVSYFASLDGIRDPSGADFVGRDFITYWMGGRASVTQQVVELYNYSTYRQLLLDSFGAPLNNYVFSYPPHSLLVFSPFGALPYVYGLILWTFGGIAFAYAASRKWFKSVDYTGLIILGPATIIALLGGQTGLWLAAVWMMALALVEKRPIVAGILIGVMTIKPQIGVLLALYLLCCGHWKAIIAASITTILMVLASILFYGVEPWLLFIYETIPSQSDVINREFGIFDHMVHSPYKWIINFGGSPRLAWITHLPFMIFGAGAIIWACRKSADKCLIVALLSVLTFLFSPYIATYDMVFLTFAACLYLQYSLEKGPLTTAIRLLMVFICATPILGVIASHFNVPLSVMLMSAFAVLIIYDIQTSEQSEDVSPHIMPVNV